MDRTAAARGAFVCFRFELRRCCTLRRRLAVTVIVIIIIDGLSLRKRSPSSRNTRFVTVMLTWF